MASDFCGFFKLKGLINYTVDGHGDRTVFALAETLDAVPTQLVGKSASIVFRSAAKAENNVMVGEEGKAFANVRVAGASMDKIEQLMFGGRLDGLALSLSGTAKGDTGWEFDITHMELRLDGEFDPA